MPRQRSDSEGGSGAAPTVPAKPGSQADEGKPVYVPPPAFEVVDRSGSLSLLKVLRKSIRKE